MCHTIVMTEGQDKRINRANIIFPRVQSISLTIEGHLQNSFLNGIVIGINEQFMEYVPVKIHMHDKQILIIN